MKHSMDGTARVTWGSRVEFLLTCVGYAVGMGNIVRFPYLCFQNGGGAFLVPYLLTLLLCALPIAFLEFSMGQYVGLSALQFWDICPLFKGLGWYTVIVNITIACYFIYILMLSMYYFLASFSKELPWSSCSNPWNTKHCFQYVSDWNALGNSSKTEFVEQASYVSSIDVSYAYTTASYNETVYSQTNRMGASAAEEYLNYQVLSIGDGISDMGQIQWKLWIALFAAWFVIYLVTIRGVKSSGKVVYITGTLPYIMLTIFVIRGLTLPGSLEGVKYYLLPEWHRLRDPKVWFSAAQQIFFSLGLAFGCFITMSSYNKFSNNCFRDAVVATFVNSATSFYAGFAVFSVIGFMAKEANLDVADVMDSGPGLAFVVYPCALATMPIPQLWSVLFFLMLIVLGVSSQFVHFETVVSCFVDQFPRLRTPFRRALISFVLFIFLILVGTLFTTQAGMYIFAFIDWYGLPFGLMVGAMLECLVLAWIYGADKVCDKVEIMTGIKNKVLKCYFTICWKFVAPVFVILILVASIVTWSSARLGPYIYPPWTNTVGWCLAVACLIPIPLVALERIFSSQSNTLKKKLHMVLKPSEQILQHMKQRQWQHNSLKSNIDDSNIEQLKLKADNV